MNDLKALTTDELLSHLANACKTYYQCGGHNKAEMNKQRMDSYRYELIKRIATIPSDDQLLETGIFNGNGSY